MYTCIIVHKDPIKCISHDTSTGPRDLLYASMSFMSIMEVHVIIQAIHVPNKNKAIKPSGLSPITVIS